MRLGRLTAKPIPSYSPLGTGSRLFEKQSRRLFREQKIAAVPHGFRSSFRDWAAEKTDHPRAVIEAALAHVRGNMSSYTQVASGSGERARKVLFRVGQTCY